MVDQAKIDIIAKPLSQLPKAILVLLIITLPIVLVTGLIMGIPWSIKSYICHATWDDSGMPVRYRLIAGCQLRIESGWIPEERYHVRQIP